MPPPRTPTAAAVQPRPVKPRLAANEEIDGSRTPPTPAPNPPATAAEAERRFYARYGWAVVIEFLRPAAFVPQEPPTTVEGWIGVAELVRDHLRQAPNERLADLLGFAASCLRQEKDGS